jgi:hypothetical protein
MEKRKHLVQTRRGAYDPRIIHRGIQVYLSPLVGCLQREPMPALVDPPSARFVEFFSSQRLNPGIGPLTIPDAFSLSRGRLHLQTRYLAVFSTVVVLRLFFSFLQTPSRPQHWPPPPSRTHYQHPPPVLYVASPLTQSIVGIWSVCWIPIFPASSVPYYSLSRRWHAHWPRHGFPFLHPRCYLPLPNYLACYPFVSTYPSYLVSNCSHRPLEQGIFRGGGSAQVYTVTSTDGVHCHHHNCRTERCFLSNNLPMHACCHTWDNQVVEVLVLLEQLAWLD